MNAATPLDAALSYAHRGWAIIPCRGKVPLCAHGSTDATTDEEIIRAWLERWPTANIGIATGPASGLYIIDEDRDGAATIAKWNLPPTYTVKTPNGRHFYFKRPATTRKMGNTGKNTARSLGEGVDTRGDGGYVVAPPSRHPDGGDYQVEIDIEVAELPAPIYEHVVAPVIQRQQDTFRVPRDPSTTRGYAEAALADECERVANAADGGRNNALNTAAFSLGQLVGAGLLDESRVRGDLRVAAHRSGLDDESEISKTIESGISDGKEQPRQVPDRAAPRREQAREQAGHTEETADEEKPPETPFQMAIAIAKERIINRRVRVLEDTPLGGINAADLVRSDIADVDWIIEGVLQREAVGIIGAEYKGCKSWLACETAISLSTGEPLLGHPRWRPTKKTWVLYVAMEDGARNMRSRLRSMAHGRRLDTDTALARIQVIPRPPTFNVASIDGQAWVVAHAMNMPEPPDVVILDPLGNIHQAKNENDSAEMLHVMNGLRCIRDTLGASILTAHHMGKPAADSGRGKPQRLVHRLRGSTAIFQSVDAWMLLDQKNEEQSDSHHRWETTLVIGTREGGGGTTEAELDVQLKPNGTASTAAWTITDGRKQTSGEATKAKILRAMTGWMSTTDIEDASAVPSKTVRTNLVELEELGLVVRDDSRGRQNTVWRKELKSA